MLSVKTTTKIPIFVLNVKIITYNNLPVQLVSRHSEDLQGNSS